MDRAVSCKYKIFCMDVINLFNVNYLYSATQKCLVILPKNDSSLY